jgi:hypothetical protein
LIDERRNLHEDNVGHLGDMMSRVVARPECLGRVKFAKGTEINVGRSGLKYKLGVPRIDKDGVSTVQNV